MSDHAVNTVSTPHVDTNSDMWHAARMPSTAPGRDTTNWPTQTEAAIQLGTGERTIRRWMDAGRLKSALRPVLGRKPLVIVDPEDVAKLRLERQPTVVVVREDNNPPANPTETSHDEYFIESREIAPRGRDPFAGLAAHLAKLATLYPPTPKPWLTLKEAAEFSGLPQSFLLEMALSGVDALRPGGGAVIAVNVGTLKQARWRFNREALAR
jgi:hypothetical protein